MRQLLRSRNHLVASVVYAIALLSVPASIALGQTAASAVPRLVKYSGTLKDTSGKPLSGTVGITFALYKEEQGGTALWLETQNLQLDAQGHYSVYLGSTKSEGLPQDVFVSGEARWLGVQPEGQAEQPRTLLLSVPYALKAGDAATVGGLPASAFVLAYPGSGSSSSSNNSSGNGSGQPNVGGSGSQNYLPVWVDNNGNLGNSILYQTGTGSSAKIGVNEKNPLLSLDVNGSELVRGLFEMATQGYASKTKGFNSQPFNLESSAFNSNTNKYTLNHFQWQAEPVGNNTANPGATLSLLYGTDPNQPTETGLSLNSQGLFTFASGQTFPGTGNGTITGVTAGTDLTGGGNSGSVTLNVDTTKVPQLNAANTFTGNQTVNGNVSVTQLISNAAQGTAPLQVTSSTQVPNLNATYLAGLGAGAFQPAGSYATLGSNSFTGNQSVSGNVTATATVSGGTVNATTYEIGGADTAFLSGSAQNNNAFLGFAGNSTTTGIQNIASGPGALFSNTTGSFNTAAGPTALTKNTTGVGNVGDGSGALGNNTTGNSNTAVGETSLTSNTTGSYNTGIGYAAGPDGNSPNLTNATAIGAFAVVSRSNALILGGSGQNAVNVGIGTATPGSTLDVRGTGNFTGLVTFAPNQTFPGSGTITGVTAGADLLGGGNSGAVTLNVDTSKVPQLNTANTFTGNQTINANLNVSGVYQLGGSVFGSGNVGNLNAFVGFAGNTTMTGSTNAGVGASALHSNTSGTQNVAAGAQALLNNTTGSYNTADGTLALISNTTGSYNTAMGEGALAANTTANYNTATGYETLFSNTSGAPNTADGFEALYFNSTGFDNTGIGYFALVDNTNGTDNTATGHEALELNTTGVWNTATGSLALQMNSTGSYNTAIGVRALTANTASYNTAVGVEALTANTTGSGNTATGELALANNTTGYSDTAVGQGALALNTSGQSNTAVGQGALNANTADNNTATGQGALTLNTTGSGNDADGQWALLNNTTGFFNVAVGNLALVGNSTGSENTAVGASSEFYNSTGSDLTCIGYFCGTNGDGLSNATAIGAYAMVGQSNALVLGGTGKYAVNVGIGTTTPTNILTIARGMGHPVSDSWETYSSRRWKTNIHTLPDALQKVEQLRGVSYDLKDSGKHEIGVIAEEVGAIVPEVVTFEKNGKDAQGVDYSRLTALLIEAVKQQQIQIKQQQKQIQVQQNNARIQRHQIANLSAQLRQQAVRNSSLLARVSKLENGNRLTGMSRLALYESTSNRIHR